MKNLSDAEIIDRYEAAIDKEKVVDALAVACRTDRTGMRQRLRELGLDVREPPKLKAVQAIDERRRAKKLEDARARELFEAGKSDAEIAAAFGCSVAAVNQWRKKHGLPSWRSRERQERKMKKKLEITENGTELTTGRSEPCDPCTEQEREVCRDCGHERDCVLDGAQQEDTEAGEYLPKERLGMTAEELAYVFERLGAAWPDCVVLVGERPVRRVRVSLCFDGEPEPSAKITLES